jgi:hypothetical protein
MYDYWLGGYHNFPADRAAADHLDAITPDTAQRVRANRQFLQRVVRMLAQQGIDQFLDLGSGLPSVGNVHEIAAEYQPRARIVYVDSDPVAVVHAQNVLRAEQFGPQVVAVQADIRVPDAVLAHARAVLDFTRPIAMLFFAVLHFVIDDDEALQVVQTLGSPLVAGSYLAISHGTYDESEDDARQFDRYYNQTVSNLRIRSVPGLQPFFDGYDLVPPGIVPIPAWHPDETTIFSDRPAYSRQIGGVGRKR